MANMILTSWHHSDQGEMEQYELSQIELCCVDTAGSQTVPETTDVALMVHLSLLMGCHYPKEGETTPLLVEY